MTPLADAEAARILNEFQRDARAMFEYLLPALRQRGLYPEAAVDGWGDSRAGRGHASTVVLASPKWLKPTDHTKELARLRLELSDASEWRVSVRVVAQPDQHRDWTPSVGPAWWSQLREEIRIRIMEYHDTKTL